MAKNKSVASVHSTVNRIASGYVKAFHGSGSKVPKNYLRTGRKGTTLRNAVAGRIKLEKKHGLLERRDHYRGSGNSARYVHGRYQARY
jgi:hypothetical protein